jgi:hypothetical protein
MTNLQELCLALIGQAVKQHVEPRCNNLPLWENGIGKLAEGLVQAGVPPVTGDEVAERALRMMGVGTRFVSPTRYTSVRDRVTPPQRVIDVTGGPV